MAPESIDLVSDPSRADSATSLKQNRWTSDLMQSGVQEWFSRREGGWRRTLLFTAAR